MIPRVSPLDPEKSQTSKKSAGEEGPGVAGQTRGSCLMSGGDLEKENFFQVDGLNP